MIISSLRMLSIRQSKLAGSRPASVPVQRASVPCDELEVQGHDYENKNFQTTVSISHTKLPSSCPNQPQLPRNRLSLDEFVFNEPALLFSQYLSNHLLKRLILINTKSWGTRVDQTSPCKVYTNGRLALRKRHEIGQCGRSATHPSQMSDAVTWILRTAQCTA